MKKCNILVLKIKKTDGRNLEWMEGALDMPPRFGGRNLQWWTERWICRLDLVEGTSNAASIWWKKPQITTTPTSMDGCKKVVVEEVTIGCYQQSLYLDLNPNKNRNPKKIRNPQLKRSKQTWMSEI
jgi:hypothetical protein